MPARFLIAAVSFSCVLCQYSFASDIDKRRDSTVTFQVERITPRVTPLPSICVRSLSENLAIKPDFTPISTVQDSPLAAPVIPQSPITEEIDLDQVIEEIHIPADARTTVLPGPQSGNTLRMYMGSDGPVEVGPVIETLPARTDETPVESSAMRRFRWILSEVIMTDPRIMKAAEEASRRGLKFYFYGETWDRIQTYARDHGMRDSTPGSTPLDFDDLTETPVREVEPITGRLSVVSSILPFSNANYKLEVAIHVDGDVDPAVTVRRAEEFEEWLGVNIPFMVAARSSQPPMNRWQVLSHAEAFQLAGQHRQNPSRFISPDIGAALRGVLSQPGQ